MRWSYKTVHYDYKKEGLLGGAFLDETEIEESMNEFGRAGWELVSFIEVQEGLIATFKQPLDVPVVRDNRPIDARTEEEGRAATPPRFLRPTERLGKSSISRQELPEEAADEEVGKRKGDAAASSSRVSRSTRSRTVNKGPSGGEEGDGGAGSIRIE